MDEASGDLAFQAVRLEAEQHQQTMQRTLRVINRLDLFVPLVGGLLLLPIAFSGRNLRENWLAAVLIVLVSAGGLLAHFNYVEFLELVRYKYSVLYPRLFAVAGRQNWMNYLEFTAPRSLRSWVPTLYYNLVVFIVLVSIWIQFLVLPARASGSAEARGLCWITAICLLAMGRTAYIVVLAARTLERDIKFALGRTWYPPLPFRSPLRLIPCGDGLCFMVATPLKVVVQGARSAGLTESTEVLVPDGFLTDLASVPQALWPIFPPWERYGPAAVLHDFLYSRPESEWTRAKADRAFLQVMRLLGVRPLERTCIYLAVRWFGGRARVAASRRVQPDAETRERLLARFSLGERGVIS